MYQYNRMEHGGSMTYCEGESFRGLLIKDLLVCSYICGFGITKI